MGTDKKTESSSSGNEMLEGETVPDDGGHTKSELSYETRGRYFGEFELLSELGHGGMGIVYRARQKQPARDVALKLIHAGRFAGKKFRQRFELEAEAIASLQHPNVVSLFEAGEVDGQFFYTMSLIDGPPLSRLIEHQVWLPRDCVVLVRKLAEAMAHVHQRGVLHRDLKPSNILLREDGEPVITDFGLAKMIGDSKSEFTMPGAVMGSPAYMAPEQAAGRNEEVSTATDVYGLGIILYTMICGTPPFGGETAAKVMNRVLFGQPRPPVGAAHSIDRDLRTIIMKCLEKETGDRYPTAAALAEELERWLECRPIHARSVGMVTRLGKWMRRSPVQAALSFVLVVVLLVAGAIITFQKEQYFDQLIHAKIEQAERAVNEGDVGHAMARWGEILQLMPENQVAEERLREVLTNRRLARPEGDSYFVGSVSDSGFSSDGRLLFTSDGKGKAQIWEADSGRLLTTLEPGLHLSDFAFLSGDLVATANIRTNGVSVWEISSGKKLLDLSTAEGTGGIAAASHDSLIGTFTGPNEIGFWNTNGTFEGKLEIGEEVARLHRRDLVFDRKGKHVAAFCGWLFVWELETKKLQISHKDTFVGCEFSEDGKRIVAWDRVAMVWKIDSGDPPLVLRHKAQVRDVAFSPDRLRLATAHGRRATVWDLGTGRAIVAVDHDTSVTHVEFSESGDGLVTGTAGGVVRVWSASVGRPFSEPIVHGDSIASLYLLSDDEAISVVTRDGAAHRWDLRDERPVFDVGGTASWVDFSPDGSQILVTGGKYGREFGRLLDVKTGEAMRTFEASGGVRQASFDPTGERVLTLGAKVGHLWLRDGEDWRSDPIELECHSFLRCSAFNHDGSVVALGHHGTNATGGAAFWSSLPVGSVTNQSLSRDLYFRHQHWVYAIDISPDGRMQASGTGWGYVYIRSLVTRKRLHRMKQPKKVSWVEFSHDNQLLATASTDGFARIWKVDTGKLKCPPLKHSDEVDMVRFSPKEPLVATASLDGTAQLWNAETGDSIGERLQHRLDVTFVAFSPDGSRVATASRDGTARVWDSQTGEPVTSPLIHGAAVLHLDFSPDGKWLATAGEDGKVRLWRVQNLSDRGNQDLINQATETGGFVVREGRVVKYRQARSTR